MYDLKTQKKFIELRAKGKSLDEISLELGVHKRTLNNWNKKLEAEIEKAEDGELDELTQKLKMSKAQRLRRFSKMLDDLDLGISGRDLKEISVQNLVALKIRALDSVSKVLDASKIEFGNPLTIKEDPFVAILRECSVADLARIDSEELLSELRRRNIIDG